MNTSVKPLIIGLAGAFCSGKDSLAEYLEENHQVMHVSTSDIVREFAMEKYGSIERPVLYQTANELRESRGYGVMSQLALERYEKQKAQYAGGVCVSGLRALAEAEVVQKYGGQIVFVDAPIEIRYQRSLSRQRDNEKHSTYEEFLQREKNENGGVNPEFNILAIKDHADVQLENGGELEDFIKDAKQKLGLS